MQLREQFSREAQEKSLERLEQSIKDHEKPQEEWQEEYKKSLKPLYQRPEFLKIQEEYKKSLKPTFNPKSFNNSPAFQKLRQDPLFQKHSNDLKIRINQPTKINLDRFKNLGPR